MFFYSFYLFLVSLVFEVGLTQLSIHYNLLQPLRLLTGPPRAMGGAQGQNTNLGSSKQKTLLINPLRFFFFYHCELASVKLRSQNIVD